MGRARARKSKREDSTCCYTSESKSTSAAPLGSGALGRARETDGAQVKVRKDEGRDQVAAKLADAQPS